MEFLGDAVLDYLMTSYFFTVFPKLKPGQLTDLRSLSVNNKALANLAVSFSLEKFLFCESIYLHEAIKDYTKFVAASPLASGQSEGPKCPKVCLDFPSICRLFLLLPLCNLECFGGTCDNSLEFCSELVLFDSRRTNVAIIFLCRFLVTW